MKTYYVEGTGWFAVTAKNKKRARSIGVEEMESAEIKMSPIGDKITNEAQARAIALVPEIDRPKVLDMAKESGVTAAAIAEAAERVNGSKATTKSTAPAQLDKQGFLIPPKIQSLWNDAEVEAKDALSVVSRLRVACRDAQEDESLIYREMNFSTVLSHLDNVYGEFKRVAPYAVCTSCQGQLVKGCLLCKEKGFLSEFAYKTFVPEELKKLRKASVKEAK